MMEIDMKEGQQPMFPSKRTFHQRLEQQNLTITEKDPHYELMVAMKKMADNPPLKTIDSELSCLKLHVKSLEDDLASMKEDQIRIQDHREQLAMKVGQLERDNSYLNQANAELRLKL